jgi:hypothetical protein
MGGEFVEIFIHVLELTYPVGKGVLYLFSTHVETEPEQKMTDQKGPPRVTVRGSAIDGETGGMPIDS